MNMMTRFLLLAFLGVLALAQGPTRIHPGTQLQALPEGSSSSGENDWCRIPVFTRLGDELLSLFEGASPSSGCFLHFNPLQVHSWGQSASVTILPGNPFDDTVLVFWRIGSPATLHVAARNPGRLQCSSACTVESQAGNIFPAGVLVAGFFPISGGKWVDSGFPIVNQHQILLSAVGAQIEYVVNLGYSITFPSLTPQSQVLSPQQEAVMKSLAASLPKNPATTAAVARAIEAQPQKGSYATAVATIGMMEELQTDMQALRTQVDGFRQSIEANPEDLRRARAALEAALNEARSLRMLAQSAQDSVMMSSMTIRERAHQAYMDAVAQVRQELMQGFKVAVPTSPSASCNLLEWAADAKYSYQCLGGKWRRLRFDRAWK